MWRWLLIGLLGVALLGATPARAMTLTDPSPGYENWMAGARVPLPDGEFTLINADCPGGGMPICTEPWNRAIYRANWNGQQTFFHEVGHDFDYWELTPGDRARFLYLVGRERWGVWTPAEEATAIGAEAFADTYSYCALRRNWGHRVVFRYSRWPAPMPAYRMRQLCTFIVRSYWR